MTKWERFGEDTWINVDHVEVVRVEEQEDGTWQLTAAFASGRTYPIGGHTDRELLVDCTDAVLRNQVGERLLDLTDSATVPSEPAVEVVLQDGIVDGALSGALPVGSADEAASPVRHPQSKRSWRFWRSATATIR